MGMIQKRLIQGLGILILVGLYSFAVYRWGAVSCQVKHAEKEAEKAEEKAEGANAIAEMEREQAPEKEKIITRYVTLTKEIEAAPDEEKNSAMPALLYRVMYNRESVQRENVDGE